MARKRLGELLVSLRLIGQEQVDQALELQQTDKRPLGAILVDQGFISEDLLLNALAAQLGVWPWRLEQSPPDPAAIQKLPPNICKNNQLLPVAIRGDLLLVAMVNPQDIDALDMVRNASGMRIEPVLADVQRLAKAIEDAHGSPKVSEDLDELVDAALKDFQVKRGSRDTAAQLTEADTRPVVGLVNQIIADAIKVGASDVHIEPRTDRIEVRYRIDGQLQLSKTLPISLHPMLVTRMKIMAELDIVEFRVPQDGRISVVMEKRQIDLRVSCLPNHHGQRIVLRILDKSNSLKKLPELGFSDNMLSLFRSLVSKPYGMFLVTGPTGSGKTTTLYAALQELKKISNNIMTCEDPVEYDIDGVNQSQVMEKVGLTFARQLRAILRQDPDIVLVGEIRDGETAETAIRAALTGHMVLSTLHCNDAPSAVPRLLDMGIDPFMLSTSLIGTMSQRLVRMLCPSCKVESDLSKADIELFEAYGVEVPESMMVSRGCPKCQKMGFKGRNAVHEILAVTPNIANMIADHQPIETIRETAMRAGYESMQVRILKMVAAGKTSLEEAQRVVFLDAAYAHSVKKYDNTIEFRAA